MRAILPATLLLSAYVGHTAAQMVTASGYDDRPEECIGTEGCLPRLVQDGSKNPKSRWSCSADASDNVQPMDGTCSLTLRFGQKQVVRGVKVAFYKGDERSRTFRVLADDRELGEFTSSGESLGLEKFVTGDGYFKTAARTVTIEHVPQASDSNAWFSVTELKVLKEDDLEVRTAAKVSVDATGFDRRSGEDNGCYENGCNGRLTRDNKLDAQSRWSCNQYKEEVTREGVCSITYKFERPVSVQSLFISLWKGSERTRKFKVYVDGTQVGILRSKGQTENFEPKFYLAGSGTDRKRVVAREVTLEAFGLSEDDAWVSVKEVLFMRGSRDDPVAGGNGRGNGRGNRRGDGRRGGRRRRGRGGPESDYTTEDESGPEGGR